jgi:hypothetical protein
MLIKCCQNISSVIETLFFAGPQNSSRSLMQNMLLLMIMISVFFAFCPSRAFCAGETSANFLKIGVGAKNVAMGETGATETGLNAVYWNPAGVADVDNMEATFMDAAWLETISFQNVAFARRFNFGVLAVSADYLSMASIDKYDNTGGQQGSFGASDKAIKLTYALDISATPEKTYAGVTLKYISSNIDNFTATAFALDAGLYFDTIFEDLRFGVVFQNLGTPMKYEVNSFSLPLNLKAGVNYLVTDGLDASLDLNKATDTGVITNAGAQYAITINDETGVFLRGGYRSNTDGLGGSAGMTLGFGLVYQSYRFDYAFVPYGDLSDTNRFSLGYKF